MAAVRIRDLLPPPKPIEMGTGKLKIRGIPLNQIVALLMKHGDQITPFFQGKPVDYKALAMEAPDLVADMIATAADVPDQADDVKQFPLADQINALAEVWKLSVPDVKKLEESLSGVIATLGKRGSPANLALKNISPPAPAPSSSEGTISEPLAATP